MNEAALKGILGLATRAGQLVTGVEMAADAVRSGKSRVVLMDADASENARKRLSDTCKFYGAQLIGTSAGFLDAACGKSGRMAAAVKTGGFAKKIVALMSDVPKQDA